MRPEELRALRRDVTATFPNLADHYAGDLSAVLVAQPWFRRHPILRFDVLRATGLSLFGARGDGSAVLLSGRLDRLEELVGRETPTLLDEDAWAAYAEDCDGWTAPYDSRPIAMRSVDDLARRVRGAGAGERLATLARDLERDLQAPRVVLSGDDRVVTRCVLCGPRLLRRRLTVTRGGVLRREDVVLARL